MSDKLRMITWLAPSMPMAFYQRLAETLESRLSRRVTIHGSANAAGPNPGVGNPFSWGTVDIGFMTAPMYRALRAEDTPSVKLLGVAPVFADKRYAGRPLSYGELVVRSGDPARTLQDLESRRFGYNDTNSLTGWLGMVERLHAFGSNPAQFFANIQRTGSHLASMSRLLAGVIDTASLDSNSLLLARRSHGYATAKLRVIESLGPWPVQPIVVRADMPDTERESVRAAVEAMGPWPDLDLAAFAAQTDEDLERCPLPGAIQTDADEGEPEPEAVPPIGQ